MQQEKESIVAEQKKIIENLKFSYNRIYDFLVKSKDQKPAEDQSRVTLDKISEYDDYSNADLGNQNRDLKIMPITPLVKPFNSRNSDNFS